MSEEEKPPAPAATGDATKAIRNVQAGIEAEKEKAAIRAEYEAKLEAKEEEERKHDRKTLFATRARVAKLEEANIETKQALKLVRWVGGTLGALLLSGVAGLFFKLLGGK